MFIGYLIFRSILIFVNINSPAHFALYYHYPYHRYYYYYFIIIIIIIIIILFILHIGWKDYEVMYVRSCSCAKSVNIWHDIMREHIGMDARLQKL